LFGLINSCQFFWIVTSFTVHLGAGHAALVPLRPRAIFAAAVGKTQNEPPDAIAHPWSMICS
jgi:hypothetical protein